MATDAARPKVEDLVSVGSRISWGAIMAGAVVALALHFLFAVLGAAVGVSISNRVDPEKLVNWAHIWSIVTTCTAIFVGGIVTSQFTVGENKMEAALYGVIMWAVLFVVLLALSAAGSARWSAMVGMAEVAQAVSVAEQTARETSQSSEVATRIAWYAFAGTWLSMLAGAVGALVGAGPTFRLAVVSRTPIIQ